MADVRYVIASLWNVEMRTGKYIIKALFKAETMVGRDNNTRQAIPLGTVRQWQLIMMIILVDCQRSAP